MHQEDDKKKYCTYHMFHSNTEFISQMDETYSIREYFKNYINFIP